MIEQPPLFTASDTILPLQRLTDRQARIYAWIVSTPGGVTSDELGAHMHADRGRHGEDDRCQWCAPDGASALQEKALRQRLIRRKVSGRWEPRDERERAAEPSPQLDELPGESWEDLFQIGDAA